MKLALAIICRGTDEEAEKLSRALEYSCYAVDGIFVTRTQPNEKVAEVCKDFGAVLSDFEWCNDFSKARNFNFQQVPKDFDYILWMDADDAIRGAEKLKPTIEAHQDVDVFVMNYMYAFDEYKNPTIVHQKTQIVRNDGCVTWEGPLHEDFKANRTLNHYLITGVERIHLSDEDRFERAKERNLVVAEEQMKNLPEDPRSYWNFGNSLVALGRNEESIEAFSTFLKLSHSDDEKYIVRLRKAEAMWRLGLLNDAIDEMAYAIGTKPDYPDAYHLKGCLLMEQGKWLDASKLLLTGLVKKPPYLSIVVYNPRDYDFVPMNNLAKCYFHLSRPDLALPLLEGCLKIRPKDKKLKNTIKELKVQVEDFQAVVKLIHKLGKIKDKEKLRAAFDKIPGKYQAHPAVCNFRNVNFIKEESTGKDLVIFCGFTEEEWTPETAKTKGIGGSEEAIIWLSQLLADKGWNVTVFNNCGHEVQKFGDVIYKPFWMYNYRDKQDVTVLWRACKPLDWEINSTKVFVDLHDVIPANEFTDKRLAKVDRIFVKSNFHRSLFPNVPDEKFAVIPNGIDVQLFSNSEARDEKLLINTSSADRSLEALLACYSEVKKEVPDAKLKWCYGWGVFETVHKDDEKMMAWKAEMQSKMKELGVEELGRVNHAEVARLYKQANIFAYPSEFGEIDCISLTKAMAAGTIPVTTDFAAMGEKVLDGIHSDKTKDNWANNRTEFSLESQEARDEWTKRVIEELKNPRSEEFRELSTRKLIREKYDWNKIVNQWNEILCTQS